MARAFRWQTVLDVLDRPFPCDSCTAVRGTLWERQDDDIAQKVCGLDLRRPDPAGVGPNHGSPHNFPSSYMRRNFDGSLLSYMEVSQFQ
jgi:hypothetical protein